MDNLLIDLAVPEDRREQRIPLTAAEAEKRDTERLRAVELLDLDAARGVNETTLRDRADVALANLQAAWDGWAGLTAAQKDAALKLQVRVTIAIVRLVLRKLDST